MFDSPSEIDSITYQMRMADYIRSANRARINSLFNGVPPYSEEEVDKNNIEVNVNYLEGLRIAHEGRNQFSQAFQKPGNYFNAKTDFGAVHKRDSYSRIVTREVNRIMKRSLPFYEVMRSKFASNILHGIGASAFRNKQRWCPRMVGVEDIMIPANTLLTMENLPLFAFYRTYTAPELRKLAKGPTPDPAWNQELVDACLEWIDENTPSLVANNWPELWSPEKAGERIKGDGCLYTGDAVPTVNAWDFYFWDDSGKQQCWKRRMIIDSWTSPEIAQTGKMTRRKGKVFDDAKTKFLFNPKNRAYASQLSEIVNFQFADLSAVAPFKYHTVRSLGFMMYAICHLQNRLRCKFSEAVLENLMQYFRVSGEDDVQRVLKTELVSKGFIDDAVKFVPESERWQVNETLAQLGLRENAALIQQNSSSYTVNPMQQDKVEKTKFEVMAEVQAMTSLVSVGLQQAYTYEVFEYREIFRRFMMNNSEDPEVRTFQAACLRQGVPKTLLKADCWDIEPERVVGAGNKTLELAITQQMMEWRKFYDPSAQRIILRDATASITDDPAKAEMMVPDQPQISDSTHDAQLAMGTLMMGLPVAIKSGINRTEYIEALLSGMAIMIKNIQTTGGNMGSPDKVIGLKNVANHIMANIQILAQDEEEKARVKQYGDQLGKMMNLVKGFEQRIVEKQQKAAQSNGENGETAAKIKSQLIMAEAKAANTRDAHAQRTAQRQVQFEMQQDQKRKEFEQKLAQEQAQFQLEMQGETVRTTQEVVSSARKSEQEVRQAERKARATEKKSGQE